MSPFAELSTTSIDGAQIACRRAGSGPAVLLIHGIPTSSRLWDGVGAELAADFDVIAPDMLGYGESDKPLDRDVSIAAQAELLCGLLEALGVGPAIVVGHDIGGGVAQIMAVREPDRLAALGLIDAVCFDSWPIPAMLALKRSAPLAAHLPAGWITGALAQGIGREVPEGAPQDAMRDALAAWDRDADSLRAFFRNVEALDSRHTEAIAPDLASVAVPTHVVWGAADRFQKPEYATRLRDTIPGATLRMIDSGHFVPWARPAEVAAEVRQLAGRVNRA